MSNTPFFREVRTRKATLKGEIIAEASYIETISLNSPAITITFNDQGKTIAENSGLDDGYLFEVVMGDVDGLGEISFTERFVVLSKLSTDDGFLIIEGLQADVFLLKMPAINPLIFHNSQPASVLAELFPNKPIRANAVQETQTYHVTNGATSARMVKKMAKDYGCAVMYLRGNVLFQDLVSLSAEKPNVHFKYNDDSAQFKVKSFTRISTGFLLMRAKARSCYSWDTVEGIVRSDQNASNLPARYEPNRIRSQLKNCGLYIEPVFEVITAGNGLLTSGIAANLTIKKNTTEDNVIDETVPDGLIITRVTHYQKGLKYGCAVELGVIHGN